MIEQGERRRRGGERDVEKGDRYIPVFVALSSRPHAAGPVDTQLCVATRPRHVGGRSPQLARGGRPRGGSSVETRAIRRLSYDNEELAGRQG